MKKIVLLLLVVFGQAQGMSKVAAVGPKLLAKTAYIGINSLPFVTTAFLFCASALAFRSSFKEITNEDNYKKANDSIVAFVKEQALIQGYKEIDTLQVRIAKNENVMNGSPFTAVTVFAGGVKHFIDCSQAGAELIETYLSEPSDKDEYVKFFIRHEINHIKNRDTEKKFYSNLVSIPLSSIALYWAGRVAFKSYPVMQQWVLPLASPALIGRCYGLAACFFQRCLEQRADDDVVADKKILESTYRVFDDISKNFLFEDSDTSWFGTHPSWKVRANKLKQRIAALEKEESKAKSVNA